MTSSVSTNSFQNIKEVIKVVNNLRDFGVESDKIELPKIVVIGVQSSGKSSLLEQIVQIDFLPRGTGVVTRCPLEIRLIEVTSYAKDFKPYAYFFEERSKTYENFEEVKKRIETITKEQAGVGKKIVDQAITLTIFQTKCPTLTLIDLPGMTLNSIEDQVDVEKVTQDMTLKYIKEETTIILCVIPINQDLENSLALKLARNVDKDGNRTIGVLTMIDIMNPGTNCEKVLRNQQIPLKHRYYGMKPRNQNDINNNISVEQAIQNEQEYFSNHEVYKEFADYTGTAALTHKLSTFLDSHIRHFLPDIFKKIYSTLLQRIEQRKKLGNPFPTDINKQQKELRDIINKSLNIFKQAIQDFDLTEVENIEKIQVGERMGRNYVDYLMDHYSEQNRELFIHSLKNVDMKKVQHELQKFRIPVNGFIPFQAIQSQIRQYVSNYEHKAKELLESIKEYLKKVLYFCIDQYPYPNHFIKKMIQDLLSKYITKEFKLTKAHIETTFKCYKESIYSKTIDVHGSETKIKQSFVINQSDANQKKSLYEYITKNKNFMKWTIFDVMHKSEQLSDKTILNSEYNDAILKTDEKYNTDEIMRYSIIFFQYMDNFRKQISDQIPQFIQTLFISSLCNSLFLNVVNDIFSNECKEAMEKNLKEDARLTEERKIVAQSLKKLKKAYITLKSLQEKSFDYYSSSSVTCESEDLVLHFECEDTYYDDEDDEDSITTVF
ncbi:dynamin central region family protein (macronuclear) [Tetrahymena thermophila SB210]|uniref:Dynamin central region family protein n=1 Tax=Tetrahymena thermophila (strain SB210) TaxID=312017 RepID=Q22AK0_TETTS|nr:dynamin central region family protein [Tetrahymena thermophila SB210]EAR82316.1 dynamin central region family protein [Tetrahymena thermophila SB210]|eukprot:XP_001029979.1 dynamin central region family protein [Tetrahymena thermophila SB210]